jgi:hypothetical protein
MALTKGSVFAPFDKSLDLPTEPQSGGDDGSIQAQIDDLKSRVSVLEQDRASDQDASSTSNDENIAPGPKRASKGLGRLNMGEGGTG